MQVGSSSVSPNRKTMTKNFMSRIEKNPLNFSNFMKPKKQKMPAYLKEVGVFTIFVIIKIQDYPDPKYFACKKYIA